MKKRVILVLILLLSLIPVVSVHAPDLGYTTIGGGNLALDETTIEFYKVTYSDTLGIATNITGYIVFSAGDEVCFAIYDSDLNLINYTASWVTDATGWKTLNFSEPVYLSPGDYHLAVWADDDASSVQIKQDADGGNGWRDNTGIPAYDAWPSSVDKDVALNAKFSLYVTYEVVAAGPPVNREMDTDSVVSRNAAEWLNVTVSDPNGIGNLDNVTMIVYTPGENFTLVWDQTADTFTETSDPDNIVTLNTTTSERNDINATDTTLSFNVTMTSGTSGDCNVSVISFDDSGLNDTDLYVDQFEFSYFNWNQAVYDLINSAFNVFGVSDFMTAFTAYIGGAVTYFSTSLTSIITLISLQFTIITNVFTWLMRWFTRVVSRIVAMFSIIVTILNGTNTIVTGIGSLWDTIQLGSWTDLIVLLIIFTWIESIIRRGRHRGEIQVIIYDLQTVSNIFGYLMGMFSTVINIVLDGVFRLFEALT